MENNDIEALKKEVEQRSGRKLSTPTDFNHLLICIEREIGESLSLATIKRVWHYVTSHHVPSTHTLSVLSRFAGYQDWESFCLYQRGKQETESSFLGGVQIKAETLSTGDEVELRWMPNRYCRLCYEGKGIFRVLESRNGKLNVGDTFHAQLLRQGSPLYVTDLKQGADKAKTYVAGQEHGITELKLHKKP